ncbi:hypothetical protein [Methanobacterium sp.]|uniref:hypothetical protein n=1 Tax=Methanobacterium sp. TaxID=2164 RepID=UPI003C73132A
MVNGCIDYNDSFNYTKVLKELIRTLGDIFQINTQPELHFQQVEQKTYGFSRDYISKSTDYISKLWQKFVGMLKEGWEMIKEFIVKPDRVVKQWLYSDTVLDRIINNISKEIFISSTKFSTEIESIEMTEAYKDDPFKEIEIDVKVPEEMDICKLNAFWDYVGDKVDTIIDNEQFIDPIKANEIKERLLIVVSK